MRREPLNERVVIQAIKPEEKKTAAGLILPTPTKKRGSIEKGTVILADPSLKVKVGEVVYHRPNVGLEIELDGKEYLIMRATDLELVES